MEGDSATPLLPQFYLLFTSILPLVNIFSFPLFNLNLTSASSRISNHGLETTVYRLLEFWLEIITFTRHFLPTNIASRDGCVLLILQRKKEARARGRSRMRFVHVALKVMLTLPANLGPPQRYFSYRAMLVAILTHPPLTKGAEVHSLN